MRREFTSGRSMNRKLTFGLLSLLGGTDEIRCVACGNKYRRV